MDVVRNASKLAELCWVYVFFYTLAKALRRIRVCIVMKQAFFHILLRWHRCQVSHQCYFKALRTWEHCLLLSQRCRLILNMAAYTASDLYTTVQQNPSLEFPPLL
jgi:hypothetical protein